MRTLSGIARLLSLIERRGLENIRLHRLPFRPVKAAEFTCLGPLANSSSSGEGLLAAMQGSDRRQACDRHAVAGDRHFLASLH